MLYFTSDLHFNHDKDFIYEPRGFRSVMESNETLIKNWNSVVRPYDDIYVLGDFFLGIDLDYVINTIKILKGRIHLVRGNHDTDAKLTLYEKMPNIVEMAYTTPLDFEGRHFLLTHYPTITANLNDTVETAVFNLHGHTHSKDKFYQGRPYMYNVAVDAQNNKPVSINQIMNDIDERIAGYIEYFG